MTDIDKARKAWGDRLPSTLPTGKAQAAAKAKRAAAAKPKATKAAKAETETTTEGA